MVIDDFGRPLIGIRVSVTQRCNLNCFYCHMEGETSTTKREMTPKEIAWIVKIGTNFGIRSVKLTGGEPLVRKDICEIIRELARIPEIEEISMTTNGTLLGDMAFDLKQAGLNRVNVSLDGLSSETYFLITGERCLNAVSEGISRAVKTGLALVKVNMVLLKGLNDHEVFSMIDFARESGATLQLIELEKLGLAEDLFEMYHCDLEPIKQELMKRAVKMVVRKLHKREKLFLEDGAIVEIVRPMHNSDFCMNCTRIRVTSNGRLKPCLMRNDNLIDIVTSMRGGASEENLNLLFKEAVNRREPYFKNIYGVKSDNISIEGLPKTMVE